MWLYLSHHPNCKPLHSFWQLFHTQRIGQWWRWKGNQNVYIYIPCILQPKWHRRNNSLHSTSQVAIIIWLNWGWAILKVWKGLWAWWFPWWCNILSIVRFCWPTPLCAGNWIGPVVFWPISAFFSFSQPRTDKNIDR